MRLYRGLTIETRRRVDGWYCEVEGKHYIIPDDAFILEWAIEGFVEVDPKTVGQFTGLLDKNGVEIYGGNAIKYYDSYRVWLTGKVIDVGGAFAVTTSENPILLYNWVKDYEYNGDFIEELEII